MRVGGGQGGGARGGKCRGTCVCVNGGGRVGVQHGSWGLAATVAASVGGSFGKKDAWHVCNAWHVVHLAWQAVCVGEACVPGDCCFLAGLCLPLRGFSKTKTTQPGLESCSIPCRHVPPLGHLRLGFAACVPFLSSLCFSQLRGPRFAACCAAFPLLFGVCVVVVVLVVSAPVSCGASTLVGQPVCGQESIRASRMPLMFCLHLVRSGNFRTYAAGAVHQSHAGCPVSNFACFRLGHG